MRKLYILTAALILVLAACGTEAAPPATEATAGEEAAATTASAPATTVAATTTSEHMDDEHMDDEHMDDEAAAIDPSQADREIEVVMTEFAFDPPTVTVEAGETIAFKVHNAGAIEHEFRVTTRHAADEHVAAGHQDHDDEAAEGGHGHEEALILVPAGGDDVLVVTFDEAGEYDVIACLLPGHYEAGMAADLQIEG